MEPQNISVRDVEPGMYLVEKGKDRYIEKVSHGACQRDRTHITFLVNTPQGEKSVESCWDQVATVPVRWL